MAKTRTNANSCPLNFPGQTLAPDWKKQHRAILKSGRLEDIMQIVSMSLEHYQGWDDVHAAIVLCAVYEQLVKCMHEYEYQGG